MKRWKVILSALLEVAPMRKLMAANLQRLRINKAFWITVFFMIGTEALYCYLLLKQQEVPIEVLLFVSIQGVGIFCSVCISLFLGVEYSDGTIRNKLIVGHKRWEIYMASLVTCSLIMSVVYMAGILTGAAFGLTTSIASVHDATEILAAIVVGWIASISYGAIFNCIGLISSNKARTSIITILIAFILLIVGMTCYSLMIPGAVPEAYRPLIQFLLFYNPFGQTFMAMTLQAELFLELTIYAISLMILMTGIGLYVFRRKDIK